MTISLRSFISQWDKTHPGVRISAPLSYGADRPTRFEYRYIPIRDSAIVDAAWEDITFGVKMSSKGTMFVDVNRDVFKGGILDIVVSSEHPEYKEETIVETLRFIGNILSDTQI